MCVSLARMSLASICLSRGCCYGEVATSCLQGCLAMGMPWLLYDLPCLCCSANCITLAWRPLDRRCCKAACCVLHFQARCTTVASTASSLHERATPKLCNEHNNLVARATLTCDMRGSKPCA